MSEWIRAEFDGEQEIWAPTRPKDHEGETPWDESHAELERELSDLRPIEIRGGQRGGKTIGIDWASGRDRSVIVKRP